MFNDHRMVKSINIYQYNGIPAVIKIHVCREYIMTQENIYIITELSRPQPIYSMTPNFILSLSLSCTHTQKAVSISSYH